MQPHISQEKRSSASGIGTPETQVSDSSSNNCGVTTTYGAVQTAGLSDSGFRLVNDCIALTKRAISQCVTFGLCNGVWLLTPLFGCIKRPALFGKPITLWRHATTVLWSLEPKGFHKDRLAVVDTDKDKDTGNIIVRSSLPLDEKGKMPLGVILSELNQKLELEEERQLTENNVHLDLYTLNNRMLEPDEWGWLSGEVERLQAEGVSVAFKPSPVNGALAGAPTCLPTWMQRLYQKLPYYLSWTHFPDLVDQLHNELKTPSCNGKRKVILVHCAHGIDRTGLVCGALKMKNGETYENVRKDAQQFAQTRSGYLDVDTYSHSGLENYAWRLKLLGAGDKLGSIEWEHKRKETKPKSD